MKKKLGTKKVVQKWLIKKNWGQTKFCVKNVVGQEKMWAKIIKGPKQFLVYKRYDEKLWVQKFFWPNINWVPKRLGS